MKTVEVVSGKHKKEFLDFPVRLLADDKNYIRPLNVDIEAVFDENKNKNFKHGECKRFLFLNENGETQAQAAVFVNNKYQQRQPTGGIGFFDCVNDQNVANSVFDFCKNWLVERGIQAMDGPINFGERDKFWGLLTEGFHQPLYGMNYQPPYYKSLFENYGFRIYFEQICFGRKIFGNLNERFIKEHTFVSGNYKNIHAEHININKLEKFAQDFCEIYNKAWATHGEGKTLDLNQTLKMFKAMRTVIDEHIAWFVYDGEIPIAMWVNLPDLNQWFKYLNGKFGFWEKLKFLWLKKFKKNGKIVGIVFGIIPEWQKKGIDGYMIWETTKHLRKHTDFQDFEMQWIGDFNPKMLKIAENLDTVITRKLATYRYLFDRSKPFERHKIIS